MPLHALLGPRLSYKVIAIHGLYIGTGKRPVMLPCHDAQAHSVRNSFIKHVEAPTMDGSPEGASLVQIGGSPHTDSTEGHAEIRTCQRNDGTVQAPERGHGIGRRHCCERAW